MTKPDCEAIRKLLVDHADGDLPHEESAIVRGHLDRCEDCRRESARLEISLKHAEAVWQQAAAVYEASGSHRRARNHIIASAAGAAACIVLVIAASSLLLWNDQQVSSTGSAQSRSANPDDGAPGSEESPLISEVEFVIACETRSARLAASSSLLADIPALATYRQNADEYLATTYRDSNAGKLAAQRLDSPSPLDSGTQP